MITTIVNYVTQYQEWLVKGLSGTSSSGVVPDIKIIIGFFMSFMAMFSVMGFLSQLKEKVYTELDEFGNTAIFFENSNYHFYFSYVNNQLVRRKKPAPKLKLTTKLIYCGMIGTYLYCAYYGIKRDRAKYSQYGLVYWFFFITIMILVLITSLLYSFCVKLGQWYVANRYIRKIQGNLR